MWDNWRARGTSRKPTWDNWRARGTSRKPTWDNWRAVLGRSCQVTIATSQLREGGQLAGRVQGRRTTGGHGPGKADNWREGSREGGGSVKGRDVDDMLSQGTDYPFCPDHKISKTYGSMAKWLTVPHWGHIGPPWA